MGRRQVLKKLVQDIYPAYNSLHQYVLCDVDHSAADIYRQLLEYQYDATSPEIKARIVNFSALSSKEKQINVIADEIEAIFAQRDFVPFVDFGGILDLNGEFSELFHDLIGRFSAKTDPNFFLILSRGVPARVQARYKSVVFLILRPLTDEQAQLYLWRALRAKSIRISNDTADRIIQISDGHPANIDYIVNSIAFYGEKDVIDNPAEFISWKKNKALDYVKRLQFTSLQKRVIRALILYRSLPSEFIGEILISADEEDRNKEPKEHVLRNLIDMNIVESYSDHFIISRPLRHAIDSDPQFQSDSATQRNLAHTLARIFLDYKNEDKIPISIIDAGIVATIQSKDCDTTWISELILPSHYIWLARHAYNSPRRDHALAAQYAKNALVRRELLTNEARLEALRVCPGTLCWIA